MFLIGGASLASQFVAQRNTNIIYLLNTGGRSSKARQEENNNEMLLHIND